MTYHAITFFLSMALCVTSVDGAVSIKRIFRKAPALRGNVNVVRSQPIDEASWLWLPGDSGRESKPTFLVFRKSFDVRPGEAPLEIDVSADERFYLTCDGHFVSRGPGRSAVDDWQYQSYKLDLKPGRHELRAVVWRVGNSAPIAQLSWRGGFILKAGGVFDARLTTGKTAWEVGALNGIRSLGGDPSCGTWGLGDQWEIVGAGPYASEPASWTTAEVVRGPAGAAKLPAYGIVTPGWKLFPSKLPDQTEMRSAPGIFRAATYRAAWRMTNVYTQAETKAKELPALNALLKNGRPFTLPPKTRLQAAWDLGRYTCAYPELVLSGGKGARVSLGWAESARQRADKRKGDRNAIVGKYLEGYGDTFVSDGRERAIFSTPWFRCGRWCRLDIETGDEPLTITALSILGTHYPIDVRGDFFSPQDPSLTDVRRICIRAQEMCAHDMLYDCPYYEQQMYPGDARVQMNVLSALSSDDRLIRRAMEMFDLARMRDGTVPMNWPTRGDQRSGSYTLCYLCMYGDYVMNHSDRSWLRERLGGFRSTMLGMELYENADGLLENMPGWQFVDWVTEWGWHGLAPGCADGNGPNSTVNLFWLHAIKAASRVERAVGSADEAAYWDEKARRLFDQIISRFWDDKKGLLADTPGKTSFSEHQQCLALLSGMMPADKAERVKAALFGDVAMSRATVYFSYYLFETYFKYARADLFLKRLDLWRGYLKKGVTALLEEPETKKKDSRSDCHAWGAHPVWFMATGLAGIRSDAPFFEKVRIAPCPGPLKDIRATYPHPSGSDIRVDLKFDGGRVAGTVETPVAGSFIWNGRSAPLIPGVNRIGGSNALSCDASASVASDSGIAPIQYWTPNGTNSWVGDVTAINFKGRMHIFYLYDEHHHQAYGGKGGHVFKHLSSADLKTWQEHPIAVGRDEPWEWIGTGTPLVKDDKLYLFYGLHSSRNGDGWEKKYPKGGSYAVSEDGVHFTKSHDIFTDDENPSPFWMDDGRIGIIHSFFSKDKGLFAADRLSGPWLKVDDSIPTAGDCPCPFSWNGWHYVIQGFVTMAASPTGKPGTYEDWVLSGDDVYGGLSVPMVAEWKGSRRILVGWINGVDRYNEVPKGWNLQVWGGWLCFRELVQFPDGRLGTKWLSETPNRGETKTYENCPMDRAFILSFKNESGAKVEFRIDPKEGRAQFSDDCTRKETLAEVSCRLDPKQRRIGQIAAGHLNAPYTAQNYAIGKIRGLERPYTVRFSVYYDAKADATLFDAEIAGTRTMVARHAGRFKAE